MKKRDLDQIEEIEQSEVIEQTEELGELSGLVEVEEPGEPSGLAVGEETSGTSEADSTLSDDKSSDLSKPGRLTNLSNADKLKFVGLIGFLLVITVIGIALFSYLRSFGDSDDLLRTMIADIRAAGAWGVLICLAMQFIQIVIAFIPGEIVQAAIGLVYGTVLGGIITLTGALISSIFIFYLVRKLGAPFVQGMLGAKEGRRMAAIQRFLTNSRRLNATVFILFLIPGMPKDIFTYLVPLTPMRPSEFFVLSTIGRAPAIFATTFVVDAFAKGNYLACAIVAVIFGGLGTIGIVFNMQIMNVVDKIIAKLHPHN